MNKQYYQSRTGFITQSALIAALYVVLTMIVAPIAFGPIQFRVSEVLCVLPYFLTSYRFCSSSYAPSSICAASARVMGAAQSLPSGYTPQDVRLDTAVHAQSGI